MLHRPLMAGLALLPLLSGCAAMLRGPALPDSAAPAPAFAEPIGALLARSPAPAAEDAALRAGLQAKANQLLAGRGPATGQSAAHSPAAAPALARSPAAPKPADQKPAEPARPARPDAVAAMLAKARQSEAKPGEAKPGEAKPGEAAMPAKAQARLAETVPSAAGGLAVIRFGAEDDRLDGEGNRQLAELARRTGLEPHVRLVVTAGLAGQGEAWQRLQLASRRAESVARHVPPPLVPDRRFDPALDVNIVQVRIAGGTP